MAVLASQAVHESSLAEQWGARLCASVVRRIAANSGDENIVRFENQAGFVSSFLSDFVAGAAWNHWYHGAFRVYRQLPVDETILTVLAENHDCLGEILHCLKKANALDAVLAALGPEGQRRLWIRVVRRPADPPSEEAFRIFVCSAFYVIDSLSLWSASRPTEFDFLRDYFRTQPSSPQWTDPSSLASAVTEVARALIRDGWISVPHVFNPDDLTRLESALDSSYDWLDKSHLKNSFVALLSPASTQQLAKSSTLRPPRPTPAQVRLLSSLLSLIRDRRCQLNPSDLTPQAHLLRILAALTAAESSAIQTAIPVLESIVETWLMLRTSPDHYSDLLNLRHNEIAPLLTRLTPSNNHLRPYLELVASTGEPAIAIVKALLAEYPSGSGHQALDVLDSDCAGLFLLVRAVQDLRLAALLRDSGFASLEPLLIALAIRIAGPLAVKDNKLDLGAALWAGISSEEFLSYLQRLATLDAQRFHTNLSDLLEAQHLVDPISSEYFSDQLPSDFLPSEVAPEIDFAAASLLRSWARWIPGLGGSSVAFLLEKLVRRSGQLHLYPDCIEVCFSPGPLDPILKMAGYLSDTPKASWLGNRLVRFRTAS